MIGFYGIGGLYNFGCEAIVRGTYEHIRRCNPQEEIVYFTPNFKYDSKKLSDLNIEVVDINKGARLIKKVINRILSKLKCKNRIILDDWKKIVSKVNCIYSIGGDMYTIPRKYWNSKGFDYYNNLVEFSKYADKNGIEIIIFGASIGPFGNLEEVNDYYLSALKQATHIYCREKITLNYLIQKGLSNCSFLPDPAFLVESQNKKTECFEKKYIGLNLSPLSLSEAFGVYNDETILKFTRIIESIIDKTGLSIKLIPHVLSKRKNDNDFVFLKKVMDCVEDKYKQKIYIVENDLGFVGIKECFRDCCIVASARMHCCINSLCEGVPALFISYSEKALGMAEYFYGNHDYVVDISDIESDLLFKIVGMIKNQEKLNEYVAVRLEHIKEEYYSAEQICKKCSVNGGLDEDI